MTRRGLYKMSTIARLSGFSPSVLRAWERRHALLEPERTEGGHRLYTEEDLRVLRRVRELLDSGHSIGEVARIGRAALIETEGTRAATPLEAAAPAAAGDDGEGRALRPWARAIVDASVAIDERALHRALDEAFSALSAPAAIELVVEPALREIGRLWLEGRCSVAGEHLASAKVTGRLLGLLEASNAAPGETSPVAIACCLPDEQHQVGALLVGYCLARQGYRVSYLGPAMPFEDLERAIERLRPEIVCLSVVREALLRAHEPQLIEVVRRHPRLRFYLGGPGVRGDHDELVSAGAVLLSISSFAELQRLEPRRAEAG